MRHIIHYLAAMLLTISSAPTFGRDAAIQLITGTANTEQSGVNAELLFITPPARSTEFVDGNSSTQAFRFIFESRSAVSVGLELSQFKATSNTVEMKFVPITALLFYKHKQYAVEPYAGIGLSLAFVSLKISESSNLGQAVSEKLFSTGQELRVGLSYPLNEQYSLFLEYRRSKFEIDFETESIPILAPSTVTSRITSDVNTNHILLGFSFNF